MPQGRVVIVGAGQAGYAAAVSLREHAFDGDIVLLGDELDPPYQRPPLSKDYLTGKVERTGLQFESPERFSDLGIDLLTGTRAVEIDRAAKRLVLASGDRPDYDHLVLATGTRNRRLFDAVEGLHALRSYSDAEAIKAALEETDEVVVLGGGFLGLEVAVAARAKGHKVHVLEAETRPLNRNVSEIISSRILEHHRAAGIEVSLGARVEGLSLTGRQLEGVRLNDGRLLRAKMLVTSVGVVPNDELAASAGLAVNNGVVVDAALRTDDPSISAIGDCARFPYWASGQMVRLESVQNAVDQGEWLGGALVGDLSPFRAVPWFWSDQGGIRLQIAGLRAGADRIVVRNAKEGTGLSAFCFAGEELLCVESINMPGYHMKGRRFLQDGNRRPTPADIEAGEF